MVLQLLLSLSTFGLFKLESVLSGYQRPMRQGVQQMLRSPAFCRNVQIYASDGGGGQNNGIISGSDIAVPYHGQRERQLDQSDITDHGSRDVLTSYDIPSRSAEVVSRNMDSYLSGRRNDHSEQDHG